METVGEQGLWSFVNQGESINKVKCTKVRHSSGYKVSSFLELAKVVAALQFHNRHLLMMFRGQYIDYKNQLGSTSLRPSIFRSDAHSKVSDFELKSRFTRLNHAEAMLIKTYQKTKSLGVKALLRQQITRWSILQHYEVCPTPMLDVTNSLRIAASFASLDMPSEAYIMVIGVPNLSGAITACAEAGIQIIRLSGICPPSAVRPHIQEGYLLTQYPEISEFDQTHAYKLYEMDFGRRLVAKFIFEPKEFWKNSAGFPQIDKSALYPESDPLMDIAQEIKKSLQ